VPVCPLRGGWATTALRWMMQTKGYTYWRAKGKGMAVKSQTYQGAATKYE